VTEKTMGMKEV